MIRYIKIVFLSTLSLFVGMKITLKNMFRKSVTLEYPKVKKPMTDRFRGMVDLKPADCVICYQCIKICPTAALFLSHSVDDTPQKKKDITKFTFNAELCCFCGLCEEICPTPAMFLNKNYEVATTDHNDINNIDLMDPNKYKKFEDKDQK